MNQKQLKQLETRLWDSADNLRANSKLTAAEYKDPVRSRPSPASAGAHSGPD